MAGIFSQPGFRFQPTDEELVMYYLGRKVNGKSFPYYEMAEIKLYEFAPWELKEQSSLPCRDPVWFFFCSREKKYASGKRTNRATKYGFWKATGNDKPISCNSKVVGWRKTLVFHEGKAPGGERTNWVNYEYRIEDDELIKAGFSKDSYVLCKVFQKSGSGPKNGEQHGAPFNEDEWENDDSEKNDTSIAAPLAGPSSAVSRPETSEILTVTGAAESVDGPSLVLDQSVVWPEAIQNFPVNGTAESITGHDSVIGQFVPGLEASGILVMNDTEEPVDEYSLVMDQLPQQSGAPVVTERHDSSLDCDDIDGFYVDELFAEFVEDGGSCNKEKSDASTHQENGKKDLMMLDGHEVGGKLEELNMTLDSHEVYGGWEELNMMLDSREVYVEWEELGVPPALSAYELVEFPIFQDGFFLEKNDLEPMQDDLFGNETNSDLNVPSSTLNIPASQEMQDAVHYLAASLHNAEETATESSARGECHDDPPSLDCIPPAAGTAAGSLGFTMGGHSKNVLSCGSRFHIQTKVILSCNKSSHPFCMRSYHGKPGMEYSLWAGLMGYDELTFLLGFMFTRNASSFQLDQLFNNTQLLITNVYIRWWSTFFFYLETLRACLATRLGNGKCYHYLLLEGCLAGRLTFVRNFCRKSRQKL